MFYCPVGVWVIEQRKIILSLLYAPPCVHWPMYVEYLLNTLKLHKSMETLSRGQGKLRPASVA